MNDDKQLSLVDLKALLRETQNSPQAQSITEEGIEAEIMMNMERMEDTLSSMVVVFWNLME
jgi:hypothetical protein